MWFTSDMRPFNDAVFGYSPLSWAAPAIRTAVAADSYSELGFLYGMMGPGLLSHKGKPGDGLIQSMRKYMTEVMRNPQNRHSPLLVSGEWNYIRTQASQQEMQMMEQRKLAWSLASAVFGVPKELLGGPDNNLSGTGVRHLQRYFAIFHAHDHLTGVAQSLSEALPRGWRIRIVPNHLLELEPAEQSRVIERLVKLGVMSPSEARAELGLPRWMGWTTTGRKSSAAAALATAEGTATAAKTTAPRMKRQPEWTSEVLRWPV